MRFDVYRSRDALSPYVVDVQAELLADLPTRVVIPLQRFAGVAKLVAALHPAFEIDGERYVLATHAIASIPKQTLRKPVASLAAQREDITRALDILLIGF